MRPKVSNEAIGNSNTLDKLYILDFGLAKTIFNGDGTHKEERDKNEFRGTSLYASINSHNEKDLSRRDDLWSLFYVMLDLLIGKGKLSLS